MMTQFMQFSVWEQLAIRLAHDTQSLCLGYCSQRKEPKRAILSGSLHILSENLKHLSLILTSGKYIRLSTSKLF